MSSPRPGVRRRARPMFDGPTYMAPKYHSRIGGRIIFVVFILLILGVIGFGGGLYYALHRAQGSSRQSLAVHVGSGDTVGSVADHLASQGLIDSTLLFKLDARIQNLGGKLKVGDYRVRRNMSIDEMVSALTVYHAVFVSVTIPEGFRNEQVASVLQSKGIDVRSFLQEAAHPELVYLGTPLLRDRPPTAGLQGYLFPDTYDVQPHSSGRSFARLMVQQLDKEITPSMRADISRQSRKVYDILTLASIVEREARRNDERARIAGVYMNRLRAGMALDADPTVQYTAGTPQNWWPTLQTQARSVNPNDRYNTYTHLGLPPGPIANPGLLSIEAAIHPEPSKYFYFLHIPHSHGRDAFATTLAEQCANQLKYGYAPC